MFYSSMAKLFSLFHPKKLKPVWEFSNGAFIWRILFASTNRIIGETRDQNKKSTSFFCLDAHSGVPIWNNLIFDEPWWIGIETVHRDVMILHEFARPDMPEHKGLRIVDIESGKILWKNDELSFWFADGEKIYTQKYLFEKRIGYALNLYTGAVLEEFSNHLESLHSIRESAIEQESDQDLFSPEPFNPEQVAKEIGNEINRMSKGNVSNNSLEYLLHRGILLVSYYQPEPTINGTQLYSNVLTIIDMRKHKTLHKEVLSKEAKVPAPDTFFVKGDFVYFIKNQITLKAVRPWMS